MRARPLALLLAAGRANVPRQDDGEVLALAACIRGNARGEHVAVTDNEDGRVDFVPNGIRDNDWSSSEKKECLRTGEVNREDKEHNHDVACEYGVYNVRSIPTRCCIFCWICSRIFCLLAMTALTCLRNSGSNVVREDSGGAIDDG